MIFVGIVGAEAAKFTYRGESLARQIIRGILRDALDHDEGVTMVSGGCHLGGIDIWSEQESDILTEMGLHVEKRIHLPRELRWSTGFEPRNRLIVRDSAVVHNITVGRYPNSFVGKHFSSCYHCDRRFRETGHANLIHVKSGGCWTAYEAEKLGKIAQWYVVPNEEEGQ